ncbi:MAG TPA: calcium-binding protein, partial [Alphaproteobacteria bacterium]|nr:calcium-binding protein [Alphaproteobacteria bacterium]
MAAGPELIEYHGRVQSTIAHVRSLRTSTEDMASATKFAATVIDGIDNAGDLAEQIRKSIDNQLLIEDVVDNVSVLRTPANFYERILLSVRPVALGIENAVGKLQLFQDDKDPNQNDQAEFLDLLSIALDDASNALRSTAAVLAITEAELVNKEGALAQYIDTFDGIDNPAFTNLNTGDFAALNAAVENQLGTRNAAAAALDQAYNDVVSKIDAVLDIMNAADLEIALSGIAELEGVRGFIEAISGPLDVVASILEPIKPILDATGFLVDLILGPIFDFLTDVLGIDDLLDTIGAEIRALLPDADFLDPLTDNVQAMLDSIRDFNATDFGIDAFLDDIDFQLFGIDPVSFGGVGDPLDGPTGIGDNSDEILAGDAGDDILDPRGGDDTVRGNAGNDIFIASRGNDVLEGGQGIDLVYFESFFNEYELAKNGAGNIVVTHVLPRPGVQSEGSETLIDIEHVVFKNISFTGAELEAAIIGGSVLNGSNLDDLMFLNSGGLPNPNGQHVANGFAGNDRIFGSTANDQLNGGTGNDTLIPGLGNDEVNGQAGSDSFQILNSGNNSPNRIDLVKGTSFGPEGQDTLNLVENLIIQGNGDHQLNGNNLANNLISAGGKDLLSGAGGNDVLDSGAGRDVLVGGEGRDKLNGGNGNDFMISGGGAMTGQREVYDGGNGFDALSYSLDYNLVRDFQNPDPTTGSAIRNALTNATSASGPVRIFSELGLIQRLDGSGNVIVGDIARNVEAYIGSDQGDILHGAVSPSDHALVINGAGGNDVLYSNGANETVGGDGDDRLVASLAKAGGRSGVNIFDGGRGVDTLDLSAIG